MKKRLTRAWFRLRDYVRWHRVIGIAGLSLVFYVLVFFVFGNMDVSWLAPSSPRRFQWPELPRFSWFTETAPDGRSQETIYTVPSRQLTSQEMNPWGGTNQVAAPAPAK